MAVGMILARAALAKSANDNSSAVGNGSRLCEGCVRLVLPTAQSAASPTAKTNNESTATASWIQEMLSNSSAATTTATTPSGLKVHTIMGGPIEDDANDDALPEMKRHKSVSFSADNTSTAKAAPTKLTAVQKKLIALAKSVANFLLSSRAAADETSGAEKNLLDFFQSPGGVMYLVMSLVETRGIDRIRAGEYSKTEFALNCVWHATGEKLITLSHTNQYAPYSIHRHGRPKHDNNITIRPLQSGINEPPINRSGSIQRIRQLDDSI